MKETHYKLKHRVTALFAAAVMLCSMLPGAAFAEEPTPQPTEETAQMEQQTEPSETDNGQTDESSPDPGENVTEATPETAEEQPAEEEIPAAVIGTELYTDLPDAPIGSYIGSEGLPVATGETKIGISEWPESQLEEGGSYLTAAALDNDGLTMAAPLLDGADYAIVPIMAQVEYPADGSSTDMILPDGVTLLDFYGEPATDADALLHNSYHETSAAVMGVYVQAAADFTAQLVYTGPDGSTQIKTLYVTIDREHTVASPFADAGIAAYGERPIPNVTSGKITKVAKVNSTWLIWFNGEPAYCCTPGADGQPKNCPTYTYVNTSMVGADQYVPGDHYGNQYRIWGGLTQLSLGMQEIPPVALSAEAPSLLDSCRTIYTDAQMQIIENYPDSTAAKILIGSAQRLLEGTDAYASARGYYTYIYQPGRAGWQTVAVIGPEISDDEPNPKPIVQEIYANWEAPAQTASGSFDFDYGIITNKVQLKTTEKVDGATIEIEPITKSGTIDGGTWNISPADKQTVTTAGHTNDDNFQNNGGAASASWTLHYSVSKTTDSRNGRVGPYTTQDEADAAADSARDAAIAELQGEAQRMVDNAVASAKAELANIKFRYEEVGVPYGFAMYWGSNGSKQTISVSANSNNAYLMKNDEWSLQVNLKKTDSETGNQIAADAQYEIFQWDTVTGKYQPTGGYNTYSVQRQGDGTYAVINSAAYATTDSMRHSTPEYNGALPVHVRLMMDEFANVALPKNFKNILAVCRSRNISCDIILQNIAQLKSLFKDDWEGIIGNCDTLLYLGGNEYGTYEYLSKILGKETERTKSQSIGKGSRGSSSDSLQTAGRELCMPDEIRRMRDDECLLLMRSEDPVIDKKYNLLHHPNVKYTPDAGGEPYVMPPDYMGDAVTITMDAVAAATAPEITEEMYEQLDYLEKHPEENYYENEENFSQYDQGD